MTFPWAAWQSRLAELATTASATEIADELSAKSGCDVGRNAVIGRLRRTGLWPLPRPAPAPELKAENKRVRGKRTVKTTALPGEADALPVLPAGDAAIPLSQRRTMLELTVHTCRWPVGDPRTAEFFFCGGMTFGELYCKHHWKRSRAA